MLEALEILSEDWRYQSSLLERLVVVTYRLRHWGCVRKPIAFWKPLGVLLIPLEFLLRTAISGQISARARIGRRFRLTHAWGIVIHSAAVVGDDCRFFHQVTLGVNEMRSMTEGPHLGNYVYVGAGVKVIGAVTVGDGSILGAGAVVVKDVPPGHVAVGVPAVARPARPWGPAPTRESVES